MISECSFVLCAPVDYLSYFKYAWDTVSFLLRATFEMDEDSVSPAHNKRAFKRPFVFVDEKLSAVPTKKQNDTLEKDGKIKEITFTKNHSAKEMGRLILASFPSLLGVELSR